MLRKQCGCEDGFSLIEVLAALTVFAIMTLGITPLLISSLRGTALARSNTVGKNLASEAMERIRGLPYFDAAIDRDVLDLYFPNLGTGYNATTKTFTTTCTSTSASPIASGARACPLRHTNGTSRLPGKYKLIFVARFVTPTPSATGTEETFTPVTPASTYNSADAATALPPSQLLEMTITTEWTELGKIRRINVASLVGERRLSPDKANARASVEYVFSVSTAYQDSAGTVSGLTATGASVTTNVQIKGVASATSDVNAGQLSLSSRETATQPGAQLASATGAQASLRAPLNQVPAPSVSEVEATIVHPALNKSVGYLGDTSANASTPESSVQVANGFPRSTANVGINEGVGPLFWADNQADTTDNVTGKHFSQDASHKMFSVLRPQGPERIVADSYTEATPESPLSSRKVEAKANAAAPRFVFLPVNFATEEPKGVVVIDSFRATVNCKSTGNLSSAVATGDWSASLRYWRDNRPNDPTDLSNAGAYSAPIALSGNVSTSVTSDPLAAVRSANPLVYDATLPTNDIYLFDDPSAGKRGYLDSWSSTFAMTSSKSQNTTSVSMPYAINIVTAQTNSTNPESKFSASIGKISCRAVDNRA